MNRILALIVALIVTASLAISYKSFTSWKEVQSKNLPESRHENAFVRVKDKFYLFGGRKKKFLEAYNPKTNEWQKLADAPIEMNHFQAVEYGGEIYVLGAFMGGFPHETPIPDIYIYNPKKNEWRKGAAIPEARRRGAAGAVVHKGKIYLICGIIDGHYDGHVNWLDEYDPTTNKWAILPDAPRARDHVQGAMVGEQLVIAGGRRSSHKIGQVLNLTVPEVDVFEFKSKTWKTLPAELNIPTQRAGCTSVTLGGQVLVIGGESPQKLAHSQTEALDLKANKWITLPALKTGRHGTQALVYQNKVYIAAGSANQGGGPELNSMEVLE